MKHAAILYILVAFAIGFGLGRLGSWHAGFVRLRWSPFQNHGEALVSRQLQANFAAPDFHLLNHISLPLADGTTQIDHILVSRFGVFVIETKSFKGWIFANEGHATWTQVIFGAKFRFQNPLSQNLRHVRAVRGLLDFLPERAIQSAVVFAGSSVFKTAVPADVYSVEELVRHLRDLKHDVMSINRVQFCVGRLETARLAISGATDLEHIESLRRRHGAHDDPVIRR
jgi:hypothetical protein